LKQIFGRGVVLKKKYGNATPGLNPTSNTKYRSYALTRKKLLRPLVLGTRSHPTTSLLTVGKILLENQLTRWLKILKLTVRKSC